jgi:hypothetical protein
MRLRVAVFALLAFALVLVGSSSAAARTNAPRLGPIHKISHSTSSNWSGYSAINGRYTTVSANWKQPTASCTSATTYSSFWVGLDGDGSNTVEQTGTSADCSGGAPRYYAWYEMYPKFPVNLSIAVRPGDSMSGSVTTNGAGQFTLHIHDGTTGGDFVTTQTLKKALRHRELQRRHGERPGDRRLQSRQDRHGRQRLHQGLDVRALRRECFLGYVEALIVVSPPRPDRSKWPRTKETRR